MAFCWLPPDRLRAGVSILGVITSKALIKFLEKLPMEPFDKNGPLEIGRLRKAFMIKLSLTGRFPANPTPNRSPGTCATPFLIKVSGGRLVRSCPRKMTCPSITGRSPVMTSASSVWPLPATPAIPKISPPRIWKDTSLSLSAFTLRRSSTTSLTSDTSFLSMWNITSRPTINRARSALLVSPISTVATFFPSRKTVTRSEKAMTSSSL